MGIGQSTVLYVIIGAIILFALLALGHILNVRRKLRRASQPGREVSAAHTAPGAPLTTFNRAGHPGDPLNFEITGSNGQLAASFSAAGWYRADEIDFVTSARISVDSILGRSYSTAPVSNLYLFGRKEDYAFERPGKTVRQRDHIRFWNTGQAAPDGRPVWIGSATKDVKVELSRTNHLPTHGISPDLDAERALVISELARTGYIIKEGRRPGFGQETHGANGGGDPYFTDGQVATLMLADVWTFPLAMQVRGKFGGDMARMLERLVRWRLPKEGRNHAARELERLKREPAEQARDVPPR